MENIDTVYRIRYRGLGNTAETSGHYQGQRYYMDGMR